MDPSPPPSRKAPNHHVATLMPKRARSEHSVASWRRLLSRTVGRSRRDAFRYNRGRPECASMGLWDCKGAGARKRGRRKWPERSVSARAVGLGWGWVGGWQSLRAIPPTVSSFGAPTSKSFGVAARFAQCRWRAGASCSRQAVVCDSCAIRHAARTHAIACQSSYGGRPIGGFGGGPVFQAPCLSGLVHLNRSICVDGKVPFAACIFPCLSGGCGNLPAYLRHHAPPLRLRARMFGEAFGCVAGRRSAVRNAY